MPSINVRWGKEKLQVDADLDESPLVLKSQLFALTGVAPDRQKVVIKGKTLGDESWNGITLAEGALIMMMGSSEAVPEPPKPEDNAAKDTDERGEKILKLPRGLKNLGNTCYMNSVLQSLKTVPELNIGLSSFTSGDGGANASRIASAVKGTYEMLSKPAENAVIPLIMMQSLHTTLPQFSSRNPRGDYEQQDANECFTEMQRLILDALNANKNAPVPVKNFFRGEFTITQKCLESPEEQEQTTSEDFYQLSCFLSQEVKYVQSGIKEKLTEEIEKNSSVLGRNAKWQKKALISRLPAYVSVQMVRFFYKESAKVNAKILKDVKFPMQLDLCDICTPALQEKLRPHRAAVKEEEDAKIELMRKIKMEEGPQAAKIKERTDGVPLPFSFSDDPGSNNSGFYELQAIITHKGRSSDSGHYVAWVRLEGDKWAMCDDDEVHPVTSDEILKLSGGGDWHCAYVLLYGPRIVKKYPDVEEAKPAETAAAVGEKMDTN